MKKILIVDANLKQRLALQEILEANRDWRVAKIGGAAQALERLRSLDLPALCIAGIDLEGLSGPELLTQIRAERPPLSRLPVILCVPAGEQAALSASTGLDLSFFVVTPFDPAAVAATVERVLALA